MISECEQSQQQAASHWGRVCRDSYDRLLARAQRLTHDRVVAEDLVQQTILRVLTYIPDIRKIKEPRRFLMRTMWNVWADRRPQQMVSLDDSETTESLEIELAVKVDLWRRLESEELLKTLLDEQRRLSNREKQLLNLHLRGWTNQEIANSLGEDIRVIGMDINKLKAKLRYRLRKRKQRKVNAP